MVEWSKDQYVNPNSQTSLGKSFMGYFSRLYAIYKKTWTNTKNRNAL